MIKSFFCTALLLSVSLLVCAQRQPGWVSKTGAKNYPDKTQSFYVNDNNAVANGQSNCTAAIQKTIDEAARQGGGIVVFKPGKYLMGAIFLKNNVRLELAEGVELLGSQDIKDYPEIDTRVAGIEMKWPAALINVIDQKDVAITGKGLINAQGKAFWDAYWTMRKELDPQGLRWAVDYDAKRPRGVLVQNSVDVTLKDFTLQQSGFWAVQVLYSKQVTVDGLIVKNSTNGFGPNTDGINIDSSSWILVQNCDVDCNDDDFCLKAGRDWDGLRVNKPTEYVVVRNCTARSGTGMLTCGSETSGGIRHVWATGLTGIGTGNGLNIKSAITRGGVVEDVHFNNINMSNVGTPVMVTMNWNPTYSYPKLPENYNANNLPGHWKKLLNKVESADKGIPQFKDIHVENVKATGAKKAMTAVGLEGQNLKDFHFDNVLIEAETAGSLQYINGWKWLNSAINTKDNTQLNFKDAQAGK